LPTHLGLGDSAEVIDDAAHAAPSVSSPLFRSKYSDIIRDYCGDRDCGSGHHCGRKQKLEGILRGINCDDAPLAPVGYFNSAGFKKYYRGNHLAHEVDRYCQPRHRRRRGCSASIAWGCGVQAVPLGAKSSAR
jgi:hypothetical protein